MERSWTVPKFFDCRDLFQIIFFKLFEWREIEFEIFLLLRRKNRNIDSFLVKKKSDQKKNWALIRNALIRNESSSTVKIMKKITKIFGLFLKVNFVLQNCQNFRNKKNFKSVWLLPQNWQNFFYITFERHYDHLDTFLRHI